MDNQQQPSEKDIIKSKLMELKKAAELAMLNARAHVSLDGFYIDIVNYVDKCLEPKKD